MLAELAVAAVIRTRAPELSEERAAYYASAIVYAAGDDVDAQAALITIGERESRWRSKVERCALPGLGGWGTFQVSRLWEPAFPGSTCGRIGRQAAGALAIWQIGLVRERWDLPRAFGRYIGARAVGEHPEAALRARIFWAVRETLLCGCSIRPAA